MCADGACSPIPVHSETMVYTGSETMVRAPGPRRRQWMGSMRDDCSNISRVRIIAGRRRVLSPTRGKGERVEWERGRERGALLQSGYGFRTQLKLFAY